MDKIALNVPGFSGDTNIPNPDGLQFSGPAQTSLGYVVSQFLNLTFALALVLTFIWFVWGAYEYLAAQGQKEALAHARDRIRWSVIGFVVLVVAFLVGNYAQNIFPFIRTFYGGNVPQVQEKVNLDSNGNPVNNSNSQFTQPQPTRAGQTDF